MNVIYKIKKELAMLDSDQQRAQYIATIGQELTRMYAIIQEKNAIPFAELIHEENQVEPVCNQDCV